VGASLAPIVCSSNLPDSDRRHRGLKAAAARAVEAVHQGVAASSRLEQQHLGWE